MQIEVGMILNGKVAGITGFGAFVDLEGGKSGMVHISEVSHTYVNDINEHLTVGQEVKVKVISVSEEGKIGLSIRRAESNDRPRYDSQSRRRNSSFSDRKNSSTEESSAKTTSSPDYEWEPKKNTNSNSSFEDMMSKFKQSSDERMSGLKKADNSPRRPRHSSKPGR